MTPPKIGPAAVCECTGTRWALGLERTTDGVLACGTCERPLSDAERTRLEAEAARGVEQRGAAEGLRVAALAWAAAWDGIGEWKTPVEAERNKLRLTVAQLDLSKAARRYRLAHPPAAGDAVDGRTCPRHAAPSVYGPVAGCPTCGTATT